MKNNKTRIPNLLDIQPNNKETAKTIAETPNISPAVINKVESKPRTLIDQLQEKLEPVVIRRKLRQGLDIYEDQVDRLNHVKQELRMKYKKKVTIGEMVREAIEIYLEQIENKI